MLDESEDKPVETEKKRITEKISKTPARKMSPTMKRSKIRKRTPTPAPTKKRISNSISEEETKVPEVKKEEEEIKVPELKMKVETKTTDQAQKVTGKETPAPTFMIKSNHLLWAIIIINTATLSMMSSYAYNYFMN